MRSAARWSRCCGLLENKYYFDWFNENVHRAREPRPGLAAVERRRQGHHRRRRWSMARRIPVGWLAGIVRRVQTGFLYTYAFWMVIGLALLLGWFLVGAR